MEFTKDIYFDNSLTNGKTAQITYAGELFKNGSEYVNLVSGFGENWENTTTTPMTKTENGFVAEIEIKDFDTFNFCFSNEHNCWDNNNYFNYVSPILPDIEEFIEETPNEEEKINFEFEFDSLEEFMNMTPVEIEDNKEIEFGTDYSASIDDIIEDILGNTVQNSISNSSESIDDILDSITQESIPEIESLFNELFFEEEPEEEFEQIQETVPVQPVQTDNEELINLFNELFDNAEKPIFFNAEEETPTFNTSAFNLDGLVSDLLEPVISSPIAASTENSLFDNIEANSITEETALVAVENDLQVSSRKLSTLYKFKKRISLACYKLFVKTPKEIAKQFGFNLD